MQTTFQLDIFGKRRAFSLSPGQSVLIGRAADSDLMIDTDPGVSKTHALIRLEGEIPVIEDAGSRNGTYVNNIILTSPRPLRNGDVITLGATIILFYGDTRGLSAGGVSPPHRTPAMTCVIPLGELREKVKPTIPPGLEQLSTENVRLGILQEIATSLLDKRDLEGLFQHSLTLIMSVVPARRGCIMMNEEGELRVKAFSGQQADPVSGDILQFSNTIRRQVMEQRTAVLTSNVEGDPNLEKAQSVIIQGIKSVMCVPLWNEDRVYGLIYLDSSFQESAFNEKNLRLLTAIANLVTMKIENYLYIQELLTKKAMEKDLELASEIQNMLLQNEFPPIPGAESALCFRSCHQLGGDYYHCFDLEDGRFVVVIADVMGKGTGAAILTSAVHAAFSATSEQKSDISYNVSKVNRFVCGLCGGTFFITLFAMLYDPASGELEYCNAGHNNPLLVRTDGSITELTEGGTLLGFLPEAPYTTGRNFLGNGDFVFLFTDGVSEVENTAGEMPGKDFLPKFLTGLGRAGSREIIDRLWRELDAFRGSCPLRDDTTAIVVRRLGAGDAAGDR